MRFHYLVLLLGLILLVGCPSVGDDDDDSGDDDDSTEATGVWVSIPGGTFDMGSASGDVDEKPVHAVSVPSFEMMRTEVTVEQYQECFDAGGCSEPWSDEFQGNWGAERTAAPVDFVDWQQAVDFCAWAGGRLPSEAEWEYAARSRGQDVEYPWGDAEATCDYAVMDDDTHTDGCDHSPSWDVCSRTAGNTDQGLCDIAGNVNEWVQDLYQWDFAGAPDDGSAWEDASVAGRVLRGGGFVNDADDVRATRRDYLLPFTYDDETGFRCAR